MGRYTRLFRIVPLPDIDREEFEASFVREVLPAVEMHQTRAGRIAETVFYRDTDAAREDRYVWMVNYDGINADWVDTTLEEAMAKLRSVAIAISSRVLIRLS